MENTHTYRLGALRPAAASVQPREPRGDYQVAVTVYVPSDKARSAMTIDEREALALGVAEQLNAGAQPNHERQAYVAKALAETARADIAEAEASLLLNDLAEVKSERDRARVSAQNLGRRCDRYEDAAAREPAANHPTLEGQDMAPPLSYSVIEATLDTLTVDAFQVPARGDWVTHRNLTRKVIDRVWTSPRTAELVLE